MHGPEYLKGITLQRIYQQGLYIGVAQLLVHRGLRYAHQDGVNIIASREKFQKRLKRSVTSRVQDGNWEPMGVKSLNFLHRMQAFLVTLKNISPESNMFAHKLCVRRVFMLREFVQVNALPQLYCCCCRCFEEVQSRALKGLRTEHGWSVSEPLCLHLWGSIPK